MRYISSPANFYFISISRTVRIGLLLALQSQILLSDSDNWCSSRQSQITNEPNLTDIRYNIVIVHNAYLIHVIN